jgi:hypothetical protein
LNAKKIATLVNHDHFTGSVDVLDGDQHYDFGAQVGFDQKFHGQSIVQVTAPLKLSIWRFRLSVLLFFVDANHFAVDRGGPREFFGANAAKNCVKENYCTKFFIKVYAISFKHNKTHFRNLK